MLGNYWLFAIVGFLRRTQLLQQLVPEPSSFKVHIATEKRNNMLVADQILVEVIEVEQETLVKRIYYSADY
jgi:hypothetical protein